jgi:hypothetical protein
VCLPSPAACAGTNVKGDKWLGRVQRSLRASGMASVTAARLTCDMIMVWWSGGREIKSLWVCACAHACVCVRACVCVCVHSPARGRWWTPAEPCPQRPHCPPRSSRPRPPTAAARVKILLCPAFFMKEHAKIDNCWNFHVFVPNERFSF